MSSYQNQRAERDITNSTASWPGPAPGKRTLTQSLPPVQRALREQQREVASFDGQAGDDFYDARATVEARPTASPLTDAQIRRARRRNPRWAARLGVSSQVVSDAPVASAAFALEVAEKQAALGLTVDGIAGPRTVAALSAGGVPAPGGARPARPGSSPGPRAVADVDAGSGDDFYDERAVVDVDAGSRAASRFADDDPFGLHLLGGA